MNRKLAQVVAGLVLVAGAAGALLWADGGANHQVFFTRPVPCGISGGNINDRSRAFCCGGTLGALVSDGSANYILSNNHVLARTNNAPAGEDIIQPGLIDQSPTCFQDANDAVADLTAFVPINFKRGTTNSVDAAIAQARAGAVDTSGTILDIGQIAAGGGTSASLGMAVAKSGRTTGFTQGAVTAVNVTIDVRYDGRCGGTKGTGRFTNQIRIVDAAGGTPEPFSAGGDSGSLIVTDGTSCPQAVGLLFAGGSADTFANPIGAVLSSFGVSMVGQNCGGAAAPAIDRQQIAEVAVATDVKERNSPRFFAVPSVIGHGVGIADGQQAVIEVYVEGNADQARRALPNALEGVPVRVVRTGRVVAY
jgi:hypothetical protein